MFRHGTGGEGHGSIRCIDTASILFRYMKHMSIVGRRISMVYRHSVDIISIFILGVDQISTNYQLNIESLSTYHRHTNQISMECRNIDIVSQPCQLAVRVGQPVYRRRYCCTSIRVESSLYHLLGCTRIESQEARRWATA